MSFRKLILNKFDMAICEARMKAIRVRRTTILIQTEKEFLIRVLRSHPRHGIILGHLDHQ